MRRTELYARRALREPAAQVSGYCCRSETSSGVRLPGSCCSLLLHRNEMQPAPTWPPRLGWDLNPGLIAKSCAWHSAEWPCCLGEAALQSLGLRRKKGLGVLHRGNAADAGVCPWRTRRRAGREHCLGSGDAESGIPARGARVSPSPSPSPRAAWIPMEGFHMGLMPSLLSEDNSGSEKRGKDDPQIWG